MRLPRTESAITKLETGSLLRCLENMRFRQGGRVHLALALALQKELRRRGIVNYRKL